MSEALVKYQPSMPVGKAATLKSLLEQNKASIAALLPRHITPDRIIKTMLVAVNRNPKLLRCTQSTVFETVMKASELGLDLSGTLGEAYPVPYKETCQLIIGYRGLAKLARNSGEVSQIEAEPVYTNDRFVYEKGTDPKLEFAPLLDGDRGTLRGFYALVRMKDGSVYTDYMTVAEVKRIQARSKAKDDGPWITDFSEMGRKTVFRRLVKWVPMSAEKFAEALETDNQSFDLGSIAIDGDEDEPKGEALLDKLSKKAAPEPTPEPEPEPEVEEIVVHAEPEKEVDAPVETDKIGPDVAKEMMEGVSIVLGTYGPRMLSAYIKRQFGTDNMAELTYPQLDQCEAWVAKTRKDKESKDAAS